jgi:hypothetical protein
MAAETIACPYCNALMTIAEHAASSRRVTCIRCGELFPYQAASVGAAGLHQPAAESGDARAGLPPDNAQALAVAQRRRSSRKIAAVILGVMAVMALASLLVSLRTVHNRRARDQEPLGYLPADTNVIAALHVAKLVQEPTGREFLSRLRLGPTDVGMARLGEWTGFQIDDLSDVVLGLKVDDRLLPRLTIVLQTRQPFDDPVGKSRLPAVLKDSPTVERNQKKLYRVPRIATGAELWIAGPSTLVMSMLAGGMDDVPLTPRTGMDHLPRAFQSFPTDPFIAKSQAWVIGHAEHWDQTAIWPLLAPVGGAKLEPLKDIQTFGLWVQFDRGVALKGACQCTSPAAARVVEDSVHTLLMDKANLRIDKDNWVTAFYPINLEDLLERLKWR